LVDKMKARNSTEKSSGITFLKIKPYCQVAL
jgi:hypothetical protein